MTSEYEKHLVFDRSHLQPYVASLPLSMIGLDHLACSAEQIYHAETIVFMEACIGDQGPRKVLKDRHGVFNADSRTVEMRA